MCYHNLRPKVRETRAYDSATQGGEPAPGVHDNNQKVLFRYGEPDASRAADRDPFRVIERWAYDTPRQQGEPQQVKVQKTRWVYGTPQGAGAGQSEISSGALLWKICYPHPETGEAQFDLGNPDLPAHSPYQVTFAYNRQGQLRGPAKITFTF